MPSAVILSPRTAMACAVGAAGFMVTILPVAEDEVGGLGMKG